MMICTCTTHIYVSLSFFTFSLYLYLALFLSFSAIFQFFPNVPLPFLFLWFLSIYLALSHVLSLSLSFPLTTYVSLTPLSLSSFPLSLPSPSSIPQFHSFYSLSLSSPPSLILYLLFYLINTIFRRTPKEFRFWLFTDKLLYGEKTPLGAYTLHRDIDLSKCYVHSCEDTTEAGPYKYSFVVESPAKSFVILCR